MPHAKLNSNLGQLNEVNISNMPHEYRAKKHIGRLIWAHE